jgi:hypothetical protein
MTRELHLGGKRGRGEGAMGRVGEKGHKEGHEEEVGRQRKEKAGEGRMDGKG